MGLLTGSDLVGPRPQKIGLILRSAEHRRHNVSGVWLNPDVVIHRAANALFASQVALRSLNRNMPEQKLDLFKFSARSLAQTSAAATKVMRRNVRKSRLLGGVLHNVPDGFHGKPLSPDPIQSVDFPEDLPVLNAGGHNPVLQLLSSPVGNRNRPDVTTLANHIDNRPMVFTLFEITQSERGYLTPSQSTGQQKRKQRSVTLAFEPLGVRCLPERLALTRCEPVTQTDAEFPYPMHAVNSGCKIGAEQTGIRCLIGKPPDGAKTQIDGSGRQLPRFQMIPVPAHPQRSEPRGWPLRPHTLGRPNLRHDPLRKQRARLVRFTAIASKPIASFRCHLLRAVQTTFSASGWIRAWR